MRKILKYLKIIFLAFLSFVVLYFLTAFCLSHISLNKNVKQKQEVAIYIMTNGIHTDIVVPANNEQMDWRKEIKFSDTKSADTSSEYLAFGWGDQKFYLETPTFSDLKLSTGLNAILGLSKSAMHTTYYKYVQENKDCVKIMISTEQYAKLVKYISASFKTDAEHHFINIKTKLNYDNADAFYEAIGSYSLFKTCNTWSNSALKSCNQKSCYWTIFDSAIFQKYN